MKEEKKPFTINTKDDLIKFNGLLSEYSKKHCNYDLPYLDLVNAWDALADEDPKYRNKVFSVFFDLKINLVLLHCDLTKSMGTWNDFFSKSKLVGGSVLDDPLKFLNKMEIHRYNSSFVFRYRSLWDKVMGLLILIDQPEKHKKYFNANSKKKVFKLISSESKKISQKFTDSIVNNLNNFDDKFRTPEVHGNGSLRKWSFTMHSLDETPAAELLGYWNWLLPSLKLIDDSFKKEDTASK